MMFIEGEMGACGGPVGPPGPNRRETKSCNCVGPQNGASLCHCAMREMEYLGLVGDAGVRGIDDWYFR